MNVQVNQRVRRSGEANLSLLSIQKKLVTGYGREDLKLVLSVRGPTLVGMIAVVCQYAEIDKINLLPILIIINSIAFSNTIQEFRIFLPG